MKSPYSVVVAAFVAVLTGTAAAAQQTSGTLGETAATFCDPDVNRARLNEQVVTHRSRTGAEDEVTTEIYRPSIEAGRMTLSRRVRRVTTATSDGSRTVEEVEAANLVAPSEPMRIVRRIVTTVRESGTGSSTTEREIFERDVNDRFVLVCSESERSSSR
jgi:hypothetical protein